jgi:UDP-N-acetylglucosamine 2-epimerase (non-hydrolysing)/GDP/UDP-N,N'-diacetylbacillosamine 2-epimerase (hydrolysing)
MRLIQEDTELTLQIIATNMHLSPEFGLTYKDIEKDGFRIDKKVEMLLSSDTANATAKSVGLATIGFADAYEDLRPDLLLLLGDRFEILAAVTAALFFKIPVAHLHGGEITEGAYDDAIRHAITKMSHLHFTSTEEYRKRVIQVGENPDNVFNVGAIGLDNIKHSNLLPEKELEALINFTFGENCILVTFHPVTLENNTAEVQIQNLLQVLQVKTDLRIIFTLPNSDTNSRVIIQLIYQFAERNKERAIVFASLGHLKYLSALQFVKAVVGNSSSAIIEVPSFGIPSLNIGNRQMGRLKSESVVDCEPTMVDIREKLTSILNPEFMQKCKNIVNPYFKDGTAEMIYKVIKYHYLEGLTHKKFYNI